MFARRLSIHLKPNSLAEFTKAVENDIVPFLCGQTGFQDEITLALPEGDKVLVISFWDTHRNAEHYDGGARQDVLKMLETVIESAPQAGTIDVLHSTLHQKRAVIPAA